MTQAKPKTLPELTSRPYADQAKWFLNGFWESGLEAEAENVWNFCQKFIALDPKKKDGCDLDEFFSHKLLETVGETLSVVDLRATLKKIDVDVNNKMALLEYLMFKYSKNINQVLDSPQGDNQKEIDEAAAKLAAVQESLTELQRQLDSQKEALAQQKKAEEKARKDLAASTAAANTAKQDEAAAQKAEAEAKAQLEAQQKAEDVVRTAEAELKEAVDQLKAQETAFQTQVDTLEQKSKDESVGQVMRSKAAAELAQLKQTDPLPLRKAKITQEAALKKVEKERKASEAVTAKAQASHDAAAAAAKQAEESRVAAEAAQSAADASAKDAEARRVEMEEQTKRVEESVAQTEQLMAEAQAFLEEQKSKGKVAHGAIWWMQREIKEAQKYLPKKKQTLL